MSAHQTSKLSEAGAVTLVIVLATAGALFALATPRAVPPREVPGLVLDARAVAEAMREDAALSAAVPDGPEVVAVRELLEAQSQAERVGMREGSFRQRQMDASRTAAELRRVHGDAAVDALRAEAAVALVPALRGELDAAARERLLGGFEVMLERYGASREGEVVAPDLVVRTLFKARFNAALMLPLTEGLRPIELEAYWGWLALEADVAPPERRLAALERYEEARGAPHDEARGVLLYFMGDGLAASEAFERAYAHTHTVRLRNHGLAALEMAVE